MHTQQLLKEYQTWDKLSEREDMKVDEKPEP